MWMVAAAVVAAFAQEPSFPVPDWERAATAESAGYNTKRLAALKPFLETLDTNA